MTEAFAHLLRQHRMSRRWSQEQLGLQAEVSPRHLSCLETCKSQPSREMVLLLASALDLPLRDRNALLQSAGFVAAYPANSLDSAAMVPINRAIALLLKQQEPYGALVMDRCWNIIAANGGAGRLLSHFLDESKLPPRIATNVVRAALHPSGLRPHLVNWQDVAALVLERLEREHHLLPRDDERRALLAEVRSYPGVARLQPSHSVGGPAAVLHLRRGDTELRIFSLLTTVGTPLDVTAQELTVESFFPSDDVTDLWFRKDAQPSHTRKHQP